MASSSARHLFLVAIVAVLAVRAADAWGGGRFFFSKTTRAAAEPEKAAAAVKPDAVDPNAAPAFSRPSTVGGSGRGYGLYGRPEENYPPDYFRRGVHRNPQKLTTTSAATTTDVPVPATTGGEEEAVPVAGTGGGDLGGVQPYPEDGSGRGRPPWYYTAFHGGRQQQQEQRRDYGMSDTRLYQNGRYYYDVDAGRYGYGRESNPMMRARSEPQEEEEDLGSGYGRPRGAGGRRGNAAGYQQQHGNNGNEFGTNGAMDQNQSEFQGELEGQNGRYVP